MDTLGFEIATQCRACGNLVAINAIAPVIACPTCLRTLELPQARWSMLLGDPIQQLASMASNTQQSAPFNTEDGVFQRSFRRADPVCGRCQGPIGQGIEVAMTRGQGACTNCGAWFGVRPAPAFLQEMGAVALVGEDPDQVAGPGAVASREPQPLSCSKCGGGLRVDGRSRLIRCNFCGQDQYLPDQLWRHFHPARPIARWYVLFGAQQRQAQAGPGLADWDDFGDAVIDAQGMLYCVGSHATGSGDHEPAVWCMGPDLRVRWLRSGLKLDGSDAHISLAPSGHVLVWHPDRKVVLVLACSDGATAAKMSGQPGELPALELAEAEQSVVDTDGTILLIASGSRLLRYTAMGQPMATWGTGPREPRPAEDENGNVVSNMGNRPLFAMAVRMGLGWDGFLYIQGIYSTQPTIELAKYERTGRQLWRRAFQVGEESFGGSRPCADVQGNVFLFAQMDSTVPCVWRVEASGRSCTAWLKHQSAGGALGDEDKMVVMPNGAIWMFGSGGRARCFGPDGRVVYISPASRQEDQDSRGDEDIE